MKRLILLSLLCMFVNSLYAGEPKMVRVYNTITKAWATYPSVSIHDIQFVSQSNLNSADNFQNCVCAQSSLQMSPYLGDTVVVQGLVITPPANHDNNYNGISYTAYGWTLLLHDPALVNTNEWAGVLLRVNTPDSSDAKNQGFNSIEIGDIVQVVAVVQEFPGASDAGGPAMNSLTQLRPVVGYHFDIQSNGNALPVPTPVSVTDFYVGGYPGGQVKYSTGEKYEGGLVKFTDLVVNNYVIPARGTFNMLDGSGNSISDYDGSHYFTLGDGQGIAGDPSYALPPLNSVVNVIKGAIWTSSGQENPRGYRIVPIYPAGIGYNNPGGASDLQLGTALPTLNTARRVPVVPTPTDTVYVTARVRLTTGGYPISRAILLRSINYGPWAGDTMVMITPDSIYQSLILDNEGQPLTGGTNVRYFYKAIDDHGNVNVLANGTSAYGRDTSKGFFFYNVLDHPMTIHDVQYTPYVNGRSAYVGARGVTISGVVTASANDLRIDSISGGARAWFIQDGNAPWSGIWLRKKSADTSHALNALLRGDSVTVTGEVDEEFDVTIFLDSLLTVNAHDRPVPEPIVLKTRYFKLGIANGDSIAEPYEDMLVRFENASITDSVPNFNDHREYAITDTSGQSMKVRYDGLNDYSIFPSDTTLGKTIVFVGDSIPSLTGILYNAFSRWIVDPRLNDDIVLGELHTYNAGWQMVSVAQKQVPIANYDVTYLFPGMTAFSYSGAYNVASSMYPRSGYWIQFPVPSGSRTFRQHGLKVTNDTIPLDIGWNLVGSLANPLSTGSITLYPAGNHLSNFFGFSGGYSPTTTLQPRQGYWVKSDSVGYYVASAPSAVPKAPELNPHDAFNWIAITDKDGNTQSLFFVEDKEGRIALRDYEMPPMFPQQGFVVRYSSGRVLEIYGANVGEGKEYAIDVNVVKGPFTVSWAINNKEAKRYTLVDAASGRTINLVGTGSASGLKSGARKMSLQVNQGVALPREFSLSQNYPNPFNPSTRVEVGLPDQARLQVAVYNILGQKVATLVDEVRDAGFHTLVWNGTTDNGLAVSSGVYFIRMNAQQVDGSSKGTFTGIRKMLLMK
ncbi:MAG: T9SS type A sorting domain-containing protein [Ignavibacteriae bacterium]|nr:T9SS type A sorting domain-containing protein [Ignavibacteria bacterium]MBI3365905.1 T9SS type A sorting domain-containing protein [Ignavibacteriota bacterium]